ncbi:MAG: hypothetical protein HUU20_15380 [Pirellulales bacterium]|nr:hypothetical protein [Pirellulales bacterium]
MHWIPAIVLSLAVAPAGPAARPEMIVDVDFNDEVIIRPEPITEKEVEQLVRDLHAQGVQTLLVRMGYLGYLPYRTQLSYPVGFDVDHARRYPFGRNLAAGELEQFIASRQKDNARYRKVIETFNPPEVFIRVGHELGVKVVMWLDIFDDGYSGHRSKFIDEHPHCQWTARDGKTHFQGLISYAWPESRAFRVAQAKELLDLGADGIHCSTSAHCRHLPNLQQDDAYGFEEPVVEEYRRRFGADLRTAAVIDKEAWHTIKGEFMNRLYRELAAACHERGKELWVGLKLGEYTHLAADPHFGTNVVARYRNLWRELVDEGIADAFIVGDYEICSMPDHAYWKAKSLKPEPAGDLFAWAARYYQPHCKGKTRLYLFGEWLPGSAQDLDARMAFWATKVLAGGFDGIDLHEAMNFETHRGMEVLKRMRERLDGKEVGPLP